MDPQSRIEALEKALHELLIAINIYHRNTWDLDHIGIYNGAKARALALLAHESKSAFCFHQLPF